MKKPAASDLRDIARNLLVKRDENSLLVHPTESARSAVDRMFSDFHSQRALMKPVDAVPEALAAPVAPGEEQFAGPPDLVARPDMLKARQGIRAQSRAKAEDMPVEPSEVQPGDVIVGLGGLGAGAGAAANAIERNAAGQVIRQGLEYDAAEAAGSLPRGAAHIMKTADRLRNEVLGGKTSEQLEKELFKKLTEQSKNRNNWKNY
jgi:hypothetical protein